MNGEVHFYFAAEQRQRQNIGGSTWDDEGSDDSDVDKAYHGVCGISQLGLLAVGEVVMPVGGRCCWRVCVIEVELR